MAESKTTVVNEKTSNSSDANSTSSADKNGADGHIEQIHTNERVSSHAHYYEKDGLRTYGDGEDHDHEPPVSEPQCLRLGCYSPVLIDDREEAIGTGRSGISVDWLPDTRLSPWWHSSNYLCRHRRS